MARLTDQEKQEITRYLEADKPLPDKYRFLLFDEKREVELVWNGKTGDVCNVVLPFWEDQGFGPGAGMELLPQTLRGGFGAFP